ncbi:MAG: hypothetical protein ACFFD4_06910 [Candidatus Odinarchaeota archaeon]
MMGFKLPQYDKANLQEEEKEILKALVAKLENKDLGIAEFREEDGYVTELILFNCGIEKLPEPLTNLKKLKKLTVNRNRLKKLPESLGKLEQLQELNLSDNRLVELPRSFVNLAYTLKVLWIDKEVGKKSEGIIKLLKDEGTKVNH